jgi:hypothetical protein
MFNREKPLKEYILKPPISLIKQGDIDKLNQLYLLNIFERSLPE